MRYIHVIDVSGVLEPSMRGRGYSPGRTGRWHCHSQAVGLRMKYDKKTTATPL